MMKCDEKWNTFHFSITLTTLETSVISPSQCQFCSNGAWSFDSGTAVPTYDHGSPLQSSHLLPNY